MIIITLLLMAADLLALKLWLVSPAEYLRPYFGEEVKVLGWVDPLSVKVNNEGISFVLSCEGISVKDKVIPYSDKLRLYSSKRKILHGSAELAAGRVIVTGVLQELRGFANPGCFDTGKYNHIQIGGLVRGNDFVVLDSKLRVGDYFALLNIRLREKVREYLPAEEAGVLNSMVLGGSGELSEKARESFSANGLSHLLSVSGTHLILLAGFLKLLLRGLSAKKRNPIIILGLFMYACVCGLRPPVLRALGMSTILMWGEKDEACASDDKRCSKLKTNPAKEKALCVLCMLLLLYKPVWLLDLGFQLSFAAAGGLVWLLPKIKQLLEIEDGGLAEGLAVTMSAQLATLPILVGNFYTVSIISLLSNLVLVPVLELATILTLLGHLAMALGDCFNIFDNLGIWIIKAAGWLVAQILTQAAWLRNLPFSTFVVGTLPLFCALLYYAVLFSFLDLPIIPFLPDRQKKMFIAGCCLVIAGCYAWRELGPKPTTVYFLDVGQGDSAVVITPQNRAIVIDTGGLANFDTGAGIVAPFLKSLGKSSIDMLFISHADHDHAGGAEGLARNVRINRIILPKEKYSEKGEQIIRGLLKIAENAAVEKAAKDKFFDLGDVRLKIIAAPDEELVGNEASSVVEVEDKLTKQKIIFTGDMTAKMEEEVQGWSSYDVLKVAHHGSKHSSSEEFLEQIKPRLAIISCGYNNRYGHPHREVPERLANVGSTVARTDLQGCIRVKLVEDGLEWRGWR